MPSCAAKRCKVQGKSRTKGMKIDRKRGERQARQDRWLTVGSYLRACRRIWRDPVNQSTANKHQKPSGAKQAAGGETNKGAGDLVACLVLVRGECAPSTRDDGMFVCFRALFSSRLSPRPTASWKSAWMAVLTYLVAHGFVRKNIGLGGQSASPPRGSSPCVLSCNAVVPPVASDNLISRLADASVYWCFPSD